MKSQMKFEIEELIKGLARKIKEVEDDPTILRCNKLLYEFKKERLEADLDAHQRGLPLVDGPSCRRLFRAMGLVNVEYSGASYEATESFAECSEIAKQMGFPADKCCDKMPVELAALGTGTWVKPDLILADAHACDIDHQVFAPSIADLLNIPLFFIDFPLFQDDKPTLDEITYVADQYGEFIEWVEKKIPGVKYDEARHIEAMEMDAIAQKYRIEIYQLLKHVPCPISPEEALKNRWNEDPSKFPDMQKVLEYFRVFRDELGERVARGTGPYPEERLRLLWAGIHHGASNINPTKLLLERKVAMPVKAAGYRWPPLSSAKGPHIGDVSRFGVKLSPIQEDAADLSLDWLGGPGKRWVNNTLDLARDIGAHGILHFLLIGCTPMNSMGSMVAERAEKELGIPTLNWEGRQMDLNYMSQERFDEILSAFVDKCFDRAGKPRQ